MDISTSKPARTILPLIVFTIFIDLLGFGILIPVIPLLLANPASAYYLLPKGYDFNQGLIILGFLVAMFPLGQFFATPILGQLSDKYGRKVILAFSLFGTCLSYIIFAFGILWRSIPILFFARFFDGITGGNISVAQAAIADVTTPENRSRNFGLIGAAFGLGFVVGPYIGGKLSDPSIASWFDATTPFWFAAALSFLNVLSILFILPETNTNLQTEKKLDWSRSLSNIARAFGMPEVRGLFTVNFFFQGGFAFFTSFFAVFLIHRFGFTQGSTGDFFAYVGVWIAITQALVTRAVAKRLSEERVLRFSLLMTGFCMLLFFAPKESWQLFFVVPFFAMGNGLSQANSTALISRSVGPAIQGEILGINASVMALAQTIPPILSGYIAASLVPEAPILVSAWVIIFAGFIFNGLRIRDRSPLVVASAPAH